MDKKQNKKKIKNPLIKELQGLRQHNLNQENIQILSEDDILDFELLLSGLSAKFSSLPPLEIDSEIENGLRLIVEFLNIDRSTLFECDLENDQFVALYSYAIKGVDRITTSFGANLFPYTWDTLQKGDGFIFSNHTELPKEAEIDMENFNKADLKSGYIAPIIIDGKIRFALAGGIASEDKYLWPKGLLSRIQFLGEIFAQAIDRSLHVQKFNEISDINQKLVSELNRFIPKEFSNSTNEKTYILSNKSHSQKLDWLSEGVKYFAEYGSINLNRICEQIGLAKSSFYNKYPNLENSKGLERYRKEVVDEIYKNLSAFFSKSSFIINDTNAEQAKIEIVDLACSDCIYFQCLGQIVINKNDPYVNLLGENIHTELEKLISLWLSKISEINRLSVIERNGLQYMILNSLYHQSLVLSPGQWKQQLGSVLDQIVSIIK